MKEEERRAALERLVGKVLAERYRLDALIGEGGMGAVFRGHHVLLKRDVAIKVLHPDVKADSEISRRFDREAQSAARLDHPNCIQVTEFGQTPGGMKYMVMPLLQGTELQEKFRSALPPGRAVELILQVVAGLEHAHTNGVIHRDLKPQNIFVTAGPSGDELLKIVDFGIAKMIGEEDGGDKTRAGLVFGTPLYMSPEQALGVEADERSDLYSVGVILFEMLAGHVPFESADPVALIRMQVSADPPPLPESVPSELAAIVRRLMSKDREDRFPNARTVRKVLIGFLESYRQRVADDAVFIPDDEPIPGISLAPTMAPGAIDQGMIAQGLGHALQPRPSTVFDTVVEASRRPWLWILLLAFAGAGAYALVVQGIVTPPESLASLLEPGDEEEVGDPQEEADAGARAPETPGALATAPSSEQLSELDREIVARDHDEAIKLLRPLREQFPDNTDLLWREARLLGRRRGKKGEALELYVEALARDPSLAQNLGFFGELDRVLRYRALRERAAEVTLEHLGERGHDLLLTFVGDSKNPLPLELRHRALAELAAAELGEKIDARAHLLLDLEQYPAAERPCTAFIAAMQAVRERVAEEIVDKEFKTRLASDKFVIPGVIPREGGEPPAEPPGACEGVVAAHEAALAALREKFPDKKKRRRGRKKRRKK